MGKIANKEEIKETKGNGKRPIILKERTGYGSKGIRKENIGRRGKY